MECNKKKLCIKSHASYVMIEQCTPCRINFYNFHVDWMENSKSAFLCRCESLLQFFSLSFVESDREQRQSMLKLATGKKTIENNPSLMECEEEKK